MKRTKRRGTSRRTRSRPNTPDSTIAPPSASEPDDEPVPRRSVRASARRTRSSPGPSSTRSSSPTPLLLLTEKQKRQGSVRLSDETVDDDEEEEASLAPSSSSRKQKRRSSLLSDDEDDDDDDDDDNIVLSALVSRKHKRKIVLPSDDTTDDDEEDAASPAPISRKQKRKSSLPSSDDTAEDDAMISIRSSRQQKRRSSLPSSDDTAEDDEDDDDGEEDEPNEDGEEEESGDEETLEDNHEEIITSPVSPPAPTTRRRRQRPSIKDDEEQSNNENDDGAATSTDVAPDKKKASSPEFTRKRRGGQRRATAAVTTTTTTTPSVSSVDADTAGDENTAHKEEVEEQLKEAAVVANENDDNDTGEPDSTDEAVPKEPQHLVEKKAAAEDDEVITAATTTLKGDKEKIAIAAIATKSDDDDADDDAEGKTDDTSAALKDDAHDGLKQKGDEAEVGPVDDAVEPKQRGDDEAETITNFDEAKQQGEDDDEAGDNVDANQSKHKDDDAQEAGKDQEADEFKQKDTEKAGKDLNPDESKLKGDEQSVKDQDADKSKQKVNDEQAGNDQDADELKQKDDEAQAGKEPKADDSKQKDVKESNAEKSKQKDDNDRLKNPANVEEEIAKLVDPTSNKVGDKDAAVSQGGANRDSDKVGLDSTDDDVLGNTANEQEAKSNSQPEPKAIEDDKKDESAQATPSPASQMAPIEPTTGITDKASTKASLATQVLTLTRVLPAAASEQTLTEQSPLADERIPVIPETPKAAPEDDITKEAQPEKPTTERTVAIAPVGDKTNAASSATSASAPKLEPSTDDSAPKEEFGISIEEAPSQSTEDGDPLRGVAVSEIGDSDERSTEGKESSKAVMTGANPMEQIEDSKREKSDRYGELAVNKEEVPALDKPISSLIGYLKPDEEVSPKKASSNPMEVDELMKIEEQARQGEGAGEDVIMEDNKGVQVQPAAELPSEQKRQHVTYAALQEGDTVVKASIQMIKDGNAPKGTTAASEKIEDARTFPTHDLNVATPGLVCDDNADERKERYTSDPAVRKKAAAEALENRTTEGVSSVGTANVQADASGADASACGGSGEGTVLLDSTTSERPLINGLKHVVGTEKRAGQKSMKAESMPAPMLRLVTSESNAPADDVPLEKADFSQHTSYDTLQNPPPRQRVVRKRLVNQPEATIEEIKIRIYTAGIHAHRGKGAERMFSNYWGALCRCCGIGLNGGGSNRRSRVMNGTREAIKKYLITKKLRRLHNALILDLLNRCVDDTASAGEISEVVPEHWRKRVNVIEGEVEPLANMMGERGDGDFELSIKSEFDCHSGLWTATGVPEVFTTVREDEKLSICLDKVTSPEDSSPPLPGALLVDPFCRSLAHREGLKVAENAVWLVMVGMREYVKSLLKNTIESTKSINEANELPSASVLIRSSGPITKERSASLDSSKHTIPAKSGKRNCITTLDLASYLMTSPVTYGKGNNGSPLEQCYSNAFDPLLVTSQSGFESLHGYIAAGIETSLPKKYKPEKDPNFHPPGAIIVPPQKPAQQQPPIQQTKEPAMLATSPPPEPKTDESSLKPGASVKLHNPNNLRSPNNLRHMANIKGMGRGAKNLAALKARAAAAASAAKNEEAKNPGSGLAQIPQAKNNGGQPPAQKPTQSLAKPTPANNAVIRAPCGALVESSKAVASTAAPPIKEEHRGRTEQQTYQSLSPQKMQAVTEATATSEKVAKKTAPVAVTDEASHAEKDSKKPAPVAVAEAATCSEKNVKKPASAAAASDEPTCSEKDFERQAPVADVSALHAAAPVGEKPADAAPEIDSKVDNTTASTPIATPTLLPVSASALGSAPRGGGRGFGTKNLAMMRARSVPVDSQSDAADEDSNPKEGRAPSTDEATAKVANVKKVKEYDASKPNSETLATSQSSAGPLIESPAELNGGTNVIGSKDGTRHDDNTSTSGEPITAVVNPETPKEEEGPDRKPPTTGEEEAKVE